MRKVPFLNIFDNTSADLAIVESVTWTPSLSALEAQSRMRAVRFKFQFHPTGMPSTVFKFSALGSKVQVCLNRI